MPGKVTVPGMRAHVQAHAYACPQVLEATDFKRVKTCALAGEQSALLGTCSKVIAFRAEEIEPHTVNKTKPESSCRLVCGMHAGIQHADLLCVLSPRFHTLPI